MVTFIDNTEKPSMSDAEAEDILAKSQENTNLRTKIVKKDGKTEEQKEIVKVGDKNSEAIFKDLEVESLIPINDKVLVKVAVKTKHGQIYLPDGSIGGDKGPVVEYSEIVKLSPKVQEEFDELYPDVKSGWRCKFNVALAQQVNSGACLIEKSDGYQFQYYVIAVGMIDFIYPPKDA